MNYREEQNKRIHYIEQVIKKYLPVEEGYQKTVLQAMNYSILAGGKRLRPMFLLESYRLFAGEAADTSVIEPFMAAIEMIHTYSLVHDDLPAMDDDEYRRGRKTTHIVYGEAMAILAGDGLLNYAYETAIKTFYMDKDLKKTVKAFEILAKNPGIYGMLGGQAVDVESSGMALSKEKLDFVYKLKTGALIEASMTIGAIMGGASEEETKRIKKIASDVGLAFQIQDDILDVTSNEEVLGKPVHSDEKNFKTTYATIMGIDQAVMEVKSISKRALDGLKSFPCKNEFLYLLIEKLMTREN